MSGLVFVILARQHVRAAGLKHNFGDYFVTGSRANFRQAEQAFQRPCCQSWLIRLIFLSSPLPLSKAGLIRLKRYALKIYLVQEPGFGLFNTI